MPEFDVADFTSLDPASFAQLVKSASDAQIAEVMSGEARPKVLNEVFRRMPHRGKTWNAIAWYLTTRYFTNALREVRRRFERVALERKTLLLTMDWTGPDQQIETSVVLANTPLD